MIDPKSLTQEQWANVANDLFSALDDIDTADDIAKGDNDLYRGLVRKHHQTRFRWQHLFDEDGDVSAFNQKPS